MPHPSSDFALASPQLDIDPEKGLAYEDDQPDDCSFQESQQHGLQKLINDPRVRRPFIIAIGPLPIFCFIFIFFATTLHNPVGFPDPFAPFVRAHIQSATMVASIIATVIASCTAYSFSRAVRYVIAIRLAIGPISLETLTSANRIAQRALWFSDPRTKWIWIVTIAFIGVSLQTPALTSLLSVREIRSSHQITGEDLDLTSAPLLQSARNLVLPPIYNELTSFFMQNAMISALEVKRNSITAFNFNGYTYLSTTGGIRPASFVETHNEHLTTNGNLSVPPNLQLDGDNHIFLPFNKTMRLTQQGFTADVDCLIYGPRDPVLYQSNVTLVEKVNSTRLDLAQLNVACPGGGSATTPVVAFDGSSTNIGAVLAVVCPISNTNSYGQLAQLPVESLAVLIYQTDLIIRASRPYQILDNTICTIALKLTTVDVTYHNSPQNLRVPTTIGVSVPNSKTDVPVWGRLAVHMLVDNIILGQSAVGSTIGNVWLLSPGAQARVQLQDAMNTYVRAAIEFSGTVIRQLLTQPDSPFIPGGWNNGWRQDLTISPLFLLPTAITIFATWGFLVYGVKLAIKHKEKIHKEDADFDPTDIVHVVAAHTPARKDVFKSFSDGAKAYIKRMSVRMDSQHGVRSLQVSEREASREGSSSEPAG